MLMQMASLCSFVCSENLTMTEWKQLSSIMQCHAGTNRRAVRCTMGSQAEE